VITAIRAELLKIRTTRLAAAMLALAAGLNGLVAVITAARAGSGGSGLTVPALDTTAGLRTVLTSGGFGLILAAVFGAIVASGEFRHKTATDTYLDEPNRLRVLTAKAAAAAAGGLVLGLAGTAVTTGTGLAFATARGDSLALSAATITRFAAGVIVASGLLAAIGAGVGSLIRNQIGAIIAILIWGFGIEQILGGLSRPAAAYLPYTAAATLAGATGGEGMPQVPSGLSPLPFGAVAALLAGTGILIAAVAAITTVQQDIT
jgi:ABC-2 type transport system permease protein